MADSKEIFALAIIGSGPAGLSASIYASRYGIRHLVIGGLPGGQIAETHLIDNYPGLENLSGAEFSQKLLGHAKKYQAETIIQKVKKISRQGDVFKVETENGKNVFARTVLLAVGMKKRKAGIAGEDKFLGKGVSYCATCDGFFYKGKTVAVVGGGNSAAGAAAYLAGLCRKVYLIYRKENLKAEKFWTDLLEKTANVEIIYGNVIREIKGTAAVEKITLEREFRGKTELETSGVFLEIGHDPENELVRMLDVETDEEGFVKIKKDGKTSLPGIWAAGDITDGSDKFRQVITAAAEGAVAARSIFAYLKSRESA